MAPVGCFASGGVPILVWRIEVVGSISVLGGVAVGSFKMVHWNLSLVCLFKRISKASVLVLLALAFVSEAPVGTCVCVAVSERGVWILPVDASLTTEFLIVASSILYGPGLCALRPSFGHGSFWASSLSFSAIECFMAFLLLRQHVSLNLRYFSCLSLVGRLFCRLSVLDDISLKSFSCCVPISCWYWHRHWIKTLFSSTVASCLPATLMSFRMATGSSRNRETRTYSLVF